MEDSHNQFDFWQNTSKCIECIYSAALFDRWSLFTDKVAAITYSDKVSLSLVNQQSAELLLYSIKNNTNEPFTANDGVRLFAETSTPASVLPSHCYFCQSNLFVENIVYQMLFSVSKGEKSHVYSEQELATLLCLLPHLINALKVSTIHEKSLNRLEVVQQIIEQGSKGIILYDFQEKIIFVNQFMLGHLIHNDFMKIVNNDLVLTKKHENIKLQQLLHQAAQQSSPKINSITLDNQNGSHALISITPLEKKIIINSGVATTLMTVNFEQLMNWALVAQEYQLTNKELNLLKALYKNKKLNELPEKFGVTINTLRTHLQSIFHKTQTNSQIELMIRLSMYKC